jgi:hypothetical protein
VLTANELAGRGALAGEHMMSIIAAASGDDLLSRLRAIDLAVPARTKGRTTQHRETWTMCRLLTTLAQENRRLQFPISVIHGDRPDVLLQMGDVTVGIEITEAISRQYAEFCALAEREFPGKWLEPGHFRWDSPPLRVPEMRAILQQSELTSDGWAGDQPEREWAQHMLSLVDAKLGKLAKPEFKLADHNWLAVYDNLPLPNIHLGNAIAFLLPLLENRWQQSPGFDVLFVEHGPVIAEITCEGSAHLLLNDVW